MDEPAPTQTDHRALQRFTLALVETCVRNTLLPKRLCFRNDGGASTSGCRVPPEL